jgi:cellulose synthase (UDP-forming)
MAHANPWLGALLYAVELLGLMNFFFYVHDLWQLDDQLPWHPPAQDYKVAVIIPTYNEPREVLLPTVAAAVTIRYPHETWVLDDGSREWVAEMAEMLGAHYHTRPDHSHAKAGNINAVLPVLQKHGIELIAVFDADHVPKSTFLDHLMGHFDDPKVALVQTPQDFYNLNSFEHARLRHGGRYGDQNLFYRIQETARNGNNSAFWCGTSAVIRLGALISVGGVATDTVTEDMHTTIKIHKAGWKTIYHNEVLARGLAAANWEQFSTQRMRWAQGGMQILRKENLLTDRRLTVEQRVSYFGGIMSWFQSWYTLTFLTIPIITVFTGALPMSASFEVFFPMWLGNQVVQQLAQRTLSRGAAPTWHAIVFSILRIPAVLPATFTLFSRKPLGFKVTPKGKLGDTRERARTPNILRALIIASGMSLIWFAVTATGHSFLHYHHISGVCWAAGWTTFDMTAIVAAARRIRSDDFSSDRRGSFRFDLGGTVVVNGQAVPLKDMSLAGGRVLLPSGSVTVGQSVTLEVPVVDLPIPLQFTSVVRSVRTITPEDHVGGHFAPPETCQRQHRRYRRHRTFTAPGRHFGTPAQGRPAMVQVGVEFIDSDTVEVALLAMNLFRTGASILVPYRSRAHRPLDLSRQPDIMVQDQPGGSRTSGRTIEAELDALMGLYR